MVLAPANLVQQTTTGTGTGNLTLATVMGKRSFNAAFGNGATTNVFNYFLSHRTAAEWEFGSGHMSDATTLVRDTVIESSNANAAVDFSVGTKDVSNDVPAAEQTPWETGDGKITLRTAPSAGWIMADDGTFGDASSGSSNRANADTYALFALFWNFSDSDAPLLTSAGAGTTRGAQGSLAAAWAAHCRMTLTRQLGRSIAIAGSGAGLTARTLGHYDGSETHTLTEAELAQHDHDIPSNQAGTGATTRLLVSTNVYYGLITTDSAGSSTAHDIMNPRAYWNVMIHL